MLSDIAKLFSTFTSSILPSPWLLLIFVLLLGGDYMYAHKVGYTDGMNAAQQVADSRVAAKQTEINQMQATANQQATDTNTKIEQLETQSAQDAQRIALLTQQNKQALQEIDKKYLSSNPVVATSCGLDAPTVSTINQMIKAVQP
jgi:uncharacterized protein HemX